jgi:hypothetical protein
MTYAREYPLYSTSTLVDSSEITTALPGVGCARCADPNRRNLAGEFLPPVAGPHGHCHACGRVLRLGARRYPGVLAVLPPGTRGNGASLRPRAVEEVALIAAVVEVLLMVLGYGRGREEGR